MDRWMGKIAVVTGASSGIGLATAKAFIRHGMTVVGLARRHEKMKTEMADTKGPGKFYARRCDLLKLTDIEATFDWIQTELGTVHILINSAAVIKPGSIQDVSNEDLMAMIGVNFMGALHCMKQAIPLMRANDENCQIVNINSPFGEKTVSLPGVHLNVYSPTKFALKSLTDTAIHELLSTKIRVCTVIPGRVDTEGRRKAGLWRAIGAGVDTHPLLDAENVADVIV